MQFQPHSLMLSSDTTVNNSLLLLNSDREPAYKHKPIIKISCPYDSSLRQKPFGNGTGAHYLKYRLGPAPSHDTTALYSLKQIQTLPSRILRQHTAYLWRQVTRSNSELQSPRASGGPTGLNQRSLYRWIYVTGSRS